MATRNKEDVGPPERLADLLDAPAGDRPWIQARALELLRSADPLRLGAGRKQRLLLSLGQGWVRRRNAWLRPVLVGALVVSTGALASAAVVKWPSALVRSYRAFTSRGASPALRPHPAPPRAALVSPPAPASISAPAVPPLPAVRRLPAPARSRRPAIEAAPEDPVLLVEATHALRVERNPVLARALATRYLERHPSGALADEAFAISIEAAIDHHDPDVAALSARYLAMFPRGSFRGLAERSLKPPAR